MLKKKPVNPFEEQDKLLDAQRQRYATLRSAAEKKKLNDAWKKKQNDIKDRRVSAWYSIPQDTETLAALEKEWNDAEAEYKQNLAKAQDLNTYYAEIPVATQRGGAHRDVWAQADPVTGVATGKEVYTDTLKPASNTKPADGTKPVTNGTPQGRDGNNTASNKAGTEDSDASDAKKEKEQAGNTSLYTGLSTYLAAKATPGGAAMAPNEDHLRKQAVMHDKQSGDEQKNAQRNFQIANRDYRVEAEKNAASLAASKNAQKVSNLGNASAGAAALERGVEDADYNTHMARSDSAHKEGVLDQREMWGARQTAEEERADADKENHDYLEQNLYNSQADTLSKGGKPDIVINNNGNQNTQPQEQPPQQPQPQPQPQQPQEPIKGDLHKLLNYITYSRSKPDIWNRLVQRHQDLNDDDKKLYAYLGSPPPLSANQLSRNNTDESVPELAAANVEPYKKFWNFYMQKQNESGNRKGTQDENGNWVGHENASSRKDLERYDSTQAEVQEPAVPEEGGNNTGSDARIKNIIASMAPYYNRGTLSDNRLKHIIASLSTAYSRR